ncbi:phosphotyrosine protein phosphatase I superfamily [Dipodascopsis uninucleata]
MANDTGSNKKVSVAFCCLGNICRSPMAEAVFIHVAKDMRAEHLIDEVDSFGTSGFHVGDRPDRRTVATCRANSVAINHSSRQVRPSDFEEFNYIFAMDKSNLEDLNYMKPRGSKAKVLLFGDFREDATLPKIIDDPYYGGPDGFKYIYLQIDHFSRVFMKHLLEGKIEAA